MKSPASLIRAVVVPAMTMLPLLACSPAIWAQDSEQAPSKPVLASTYVAPPKPVAVAQPAPAPEAKTVIEPSAGARPSVVPLESPPDKGEPDVKYIVIEADGTRIEELRVRGVSQRLTVQTRIGPREGYEIIMGDGSRDLSPGANTSRGAAGQRVWHVLSF